MLAKHLLLTIILAVVGVGVGARVGQRRGRGRARPRGARAAHVGGTAGGRGPGSVVGRDQPAHSTNGVIAPAATRALLGACCAVYTI